MLKCLILDKLVLPRDTHLILFCNLSQILCFFHMNIPIIHPHCILRNYAEEKCLHLPVERRSQIIPPTLAHRGLSLLFYAPSLQPTCQRIGPVMFIFSVLIYTSILILFNFYLGTSYKLWAYSKVKLEINFFKEIVLLILAIIIFFFIHYLL